MKERDIFNQILSWTDLPIEDRPLFIASYISLIDSVGHKYGPDSPEVRI